MTSRSLRYLRLIEVYGSPYAHGCLKAGVAQPDIVMNAGLNTFHCMSRT